MIYDAETGAFVPLITTGGLLVSAELHPWVIIRTSTLEDCECPYLQGCIRRLMESRMRARAERIARVGGPSVAGTSGSAGGGAEDQNVGCDDDLITLAGSDTDEGPDIRVMVVFGDDGNGGDDESDPDYTMPDHTSGEESSEEEEGGSEEEGEINEAMDAEPEEEEEEEAMETDCEEELVVERSVIDLTWLSDN